MCTWSTQRSELKDSRAIAMQNGFRPRRRPAEAWLFGALIFVLSVALTATIPGLSVAGSALEIDGSKSSQKAQDTDHRTGIRYRSLVDRILEPAPTGGHDALEAPLASVPATFVFRNVSARKFGLAARLQQRGFSARAPPARHA